MTAQSPAGNGSTKSPEPVVRVVTQYIKDLSFESPSVVKMAMSQTDNPNLRISVNVSAGSADQARHLYESAIHFKAAATNKLGVIFDCELLYAGIFQIENLPDDALEPFLMINCPMLLFPFLRRIVADVTREGAPGFPPLLLDPVDFAALYMQEKQKQTATA